MITALKHLRRYGPILVIAALIGYFGAFPADAVRIYPDLVEGVGQSKVGTDTVTMIGATTDTGKTFVVKPITNQRHRDLNVWPDSAKYVLTFASGHVTGGDSSTFIITPIGGYPISDDVTVWVRGTPTDTLRYATSTTPRLRQWNFAWNQFVPPGLPRQKGEVQVKLEFTGGVGNDTTFVLSEHLILYSRTESE